MSNFFRSRKGVVDGAFIDVVFLTSLTLSVKSGEPHNVVEEHGEFNPSKFHVATFQQFLRSIRCNPDTLDCSSLWPELRAFNSVLATACLLDEVEIGVSCMGIIEYAFADISAIIWQCCCPARVG